ncbi:FAD-binding domain-containing protein [Klenkia brasiliensis]|uniref:Deoxyribodipyrimidine photo-lyase n=1 Tax=Klenkia brasiliensis TaxID=333142 RepID=A0A1G7N5B9_9ACTN|nr:FAD-binding domain-containing protein [Klenkia brasiliensis]SDF69233.1 deoxyribodipyrimidine photo-lyase [Klenkia brasiliensis]
MPQLPVPAVDAVPAWVGEHLGHLHRDDAVAPSGRFRGGQAAADAALATLDVTGYAGRRNQVLPASRRGASAMSPYIRHGLLQLPEVWDAVADAPTRDRTKYRDELLWQEYSRHLYARLGTRTRSALRAEPARAHARWQEPWPRDMLCLDTVLGELDDDGWLVNQTRMWVSSQWTVRAGHDWAEGEDELFARLLDGSRAANRVGWQWTVGAGNGKAYGFSRWQVRKRAPGLCERCPLAADCPIEDWPDDQPPRWLDREPLLAADPSPDVSAGPADVESTGEPEAVWLTAESLGTSDPALAAHPDLPVVFVLDEPLLTRLRLASKRLVFLVETLAELAEDREVHLHLGDPVDELAGRALAVTHAPVPGFRRRAAALAPVEVHPWPWLRRPGGGPVSSFSAWRKSVPRR